MFVNVCGPIQNQFPKRQITHRKMKCVYHGVLHFFHRNRIVILSNIKSVAECHLTVLSIENHSYLSCYIVWPRHAHHRFYLRTKWRVRFGACKCAAVSDDWLIDWDLFYQGKHLGKHEPVCSTIDRDYDCGDEIAVIISHNLNFNGPYIHFFTWDMSPMAMNDLDM